MKTVTINDTTELFGDEGVNYILTTDHPASKYDVPVLVNLSNGCVFGKSDKLTNTCNDNTASSYVYDCAATQSPQILNNDLVVKFLNS